MGGVKESIEKAVQYLTENPADARSTDSRATATLGDALRVEVAGPSGETMVTDMVGGVGGLGEHPSPGWYFRAAIASCVVTTIGMEAAREGIELTSLEVEVDSESDDRGILGIDESVPAGPLSTRVQVRAKANGVDDGRLREILEVGAARCPVCDATKRAVDVTLDFQTS
jgi:uncharacterized OsmC-like protein